MAEKNRSRPDNWYRQLVARFYDWFLADLEERALNARRTELIGEVQGLILEVGAGTGVNFPIYPAGANVLAVEPSEAMLRYARRRLASHKVEARIELLRAGIGDATVTDRLFPGSVDAIVATLVLCTVPDPVAAIQSFHRWLKPNGSLYVLEHIRANDHTTRMAQDLANPLWKHLADGCHLNRRTDQTLKALGFVPVWEKYFNKGLPFYQAAMKKVA